MDRRAFVKTVAVGALFGAGCEFTSVGTVKKRKPNIILIMADDLGYAELGCYGQKKIKTPNIDRIRAEGMKLTDHYSGSAVCAPSRCVLLTGKHSGHSYIRGNKEVGGWETFKGQLPLPEGTETFAKMLKRKGYATGAFGKWGLGAVGSTGDPLNMGFDRFVGYNCQRHAHNLYPRFLIKDKGEIALEGNTRGQTGETYAPQVIADHVMEFVRENKDNAFFLYWPTVIPHLALQAPQEDIDEYKGKWDDEAYTGNSYQKHATPKACYAAMISFMDRQVGRLMELLKDNGLDDDTLVLFTSDNGTTHLKRQVDFEFFESVGPLRGLKGRLYEGGIRVPFIARWPGRIKAGSTSGHVSAAWDVLPTLAEVVGAEKPVDIDGVSFAATLFGKGRQKEHEFLYWEFPSYGGQVAVRMGDWKGIRAGLMKKPNAAIELYDLKEDVGEKNDVAEKYPEVAGRIQQIMKREHADSENFPFAALDGK